MKHFAAFLFLSFSASAQQTDTATQQLSNVAVKAFEQTHKYKDVPAAVSYINRSVIERYNPGSVVSAMNTIAGVRMEERSPGSYRLNIRGSSLRSPFGVRNIKVYYNDIPFTDPGGQTYLNELGSYNFNSTEVIKVPSGSLYGAGTGGVLLIDGMFSSKETAFAEYSYGSYNSHNAYASVVLGEENKTQIGFQHQQSNGYRDHSALRRDVFSWNGAYHVNKNTFLKTTLLYGDLEYETPGALTFSEFNTDPKSSRPAAGIFPSAANAHAAVKQKMFLAGASLTQNITAKIQNKTVLYGMCTDLRNPTIQNYGHNTEPHTGARTVFSYHFSKWSLQAGGELQQGFADVSVYKNVSGNADSMRTKDKINNRNAFAFSQLNYENENWIITAAASINDLRVAFERTMPFASAKLIKNFSGNILPRLAVMKKFKTINLYASAAQGYSPPVTAELFPSGNEANTELNAERGINYELGLKGNILRSVFIDITAFDYHLKNAIVQRRTAGGGDVYTNAGGTKQKGIETTIQYSLFKNASPTKAKFWLSHTWNNFHYAEFKQLSNDYSNNRLPSVPKHSLAAGVDMNLKESFSASLNYYYSGRIALNDANSAFADRYHLLGTKLKYSFRNKIFSYTVAAGAENILNKKYSLGNDINAFGGRYYNAAPGRNFYISVNFLLR